MTSFAAMLGAVVLARGVNDPKLREALIDSMRRRLLPAPEESPRRQAQEKVTRREAQESPSRRQAPGRKEKRHVG
jgi:hypothetical protein